jgi:hypothetical protein
MGRHAKLYLEDIQILSEVSSVTKSVYMALCYHFQQVEEDGYRTRTAKVSLKKIAEISGYSYGSVKRGIEEMKRIHYLIDGEKHYIYSFEKRFGRASEIKIHYPVGSHVKPTIDEKVKPIVSSTVKPIEGSTVEPIVGSHVKPSINKTNNNYNNNYINSNYSDSESATSLSEKQIYIIKKYMNYFNWKNDNWKNELNSQIPSYAFDYLDNALIYIGIWNYQKKLEGNRQWTSNYWIQGVVSWIKRGKPRKPTPQQEADAKTLHAEVIQFEPKPKPIVKPELKIVKPTLDELARDCIKRHKEEPNWGTDMMLKSYLKSDLVSEEIKNQIRSIS